MKARRWREVVEILCRNPLIRRRIWWTNADQLFFAERRRFDEQGVTLKQFKKLLLQLSDLLEVHPCIVVVAVLSHAGIVPDKEVGTSSDESGILAK